VKELKIDFHSFIWRAVKERARTEIDDLRRQNDRKGLSHDETMHLRGRIHQLKELIKLDPTEKDEP